MTARVLGRVALLTAVVASLLGQPAMAEDGSSKAIKACKEHVDRVMKSPTGTTHGPDSDLKVNDHGSDKFTVAGIVSGNRAGGAHIQADWECEVEKVGAGLMHTKTKLFLPN